MNRLRLAIALSLSLGCSLAGCTDLDDTTSTEAQALASECSSPVKFDGNWPQIGQWTGTAPPAVSKTQYFVMAAMDTQDKEFMVVQADWENGKIPWAIKISRAQRAQVAAVLAIEVGNFHALNGIRIPTGRPPGDPEGQWVIDHGYFSSLPH